MKKTRMVGRIEQRCSHTYVRVRTIIVGDRCEPVGEYSLLHLQGSRLTRVLAYLLLEGARRLASLHTGEVG